MGWVGSSSSPTGHSERSAASRSERRAVEEPGATEAAVTFDRAAFLPPCDKYPIRCE